MGDVFFVFLVDKFYVNEDYVGWLKVLGWMVELLIFYYCVEEEFVGG